MRIKSGEFVRARLSGPIVPPGSEDDPTVEGGRLRIFDTALGGAGEAVFDLPADGWMALGKPGRQKGFRFSGGGCKRVRVVLGRIEIACGGGDLNPPFLGDVGVVLELGSNTTSYGTQFPPSSCEKNDASVVACENAGIPGGMPAIGQTPTPTFAPPPPPQPTATPNPCASLPDGQTCDAGTDGVVLTCQSGVCGACAPAGTCSVTTATACAFDEQCPGVETCNLGPDPSPRYVDNGDGTVTDRRTCLVWEQKTGTVGAPVQCSPACADPHEVNSSYAWTSMVGGTAFDGPAKMLFIDALNGSNFAGHGDWRLPTSGGRSDLSLASGEAPELESILTCPPPYDGTTCVGVPPFPGTAARIDTIFGPTWSLFYWSATTYAVDTTRAWDVGFNNGAVAFTTAKDEPNFVRAVRGG